MSAKEKGPLRKVTDKLGLTTDHPFRMSKTRRFQMFYGIDPVTNKRNEKRHWMSVDKKHKWEQVKTDIHVEFGRGRLMSEWEELFFGNPDEFNRLNNPSLDKALRSSDASQGEIDFLTGKVKKDPIPFHKINYQAENTGPEREELIIDLTPKRPFLAIETEMPGTAQVNGRSRISRTSSYRVLQEKITMRRKLRVGNINIPLPPKRTSNLFPDYGHM